MKTTKELILDESLKLFSQNSYHGASIRDIAKAIDKRESAIYNHFRSKEEIFNQIVHSFSKRNIGPLIITDKLIKHLSKPEKFFLLLSENLINFWDSKNERMFIKILFSINIINKSSDNYSLETYIKDFRNLCEFIFKEMIKHNFVNKTSITTLSHEFINPLFLIELEQIFGINKEKEINSFVKNHVDYFWNAIKSEAI